MEYNEHITYIKSLEAQIEFFKIKCEKLTKRVADLEKVLYDENWQEDYHNNLDDCE